MCLLLQKVFCTEHKISFYLGFASINESEDHWVCISLTWTHLLMNCCTVQDCGLMSAKWSIFDYLSPFSSNWCYMLRLSTISCLILRIIFCYLIWFSWPMEVIYDIWFLSAKSISPYKSIRNNNWPLYKKVIGQPTVIFWTDLSALCVRCCIQASMISGIRFRRRRFFNLYVIILLYVIWLRFLWLQGKSWFKGVKS